MPIGTIEKMEAHQKALLHRAFSVFIFNTKGEMLLQQRALDKYHSGGLWTNACCSHPYDGQDTQAAAEKRLQEELEAAKNNWEEESKHKRFPIEEEDIAEVVCMMTGIPVKRMVQAETEKLRRMGDDLWLARSKQAGLATKIRVPLGEEAMPRVRADCLPGGCNAARPCPWTCCRHNIAAEPGWSQMGGSHAQRDLLDLTLIEAALRAGQRPLATALCAERLTTRGHSPLTRQLLARTEPLRNAA